MFWKGLILCAYSKLDWDRVDSILYGQTTSNVEFNYNGVTMVNEMLVLNTTLDKSQELLQGVKGNPIHCISMAMMFLNKM